MVIPGRTGDPVLDIVGYGLLVAGTVSILAGAGTAVLLLHVWYKDPVPTHNLSSADGAVEVEGTAQPIGEPLEGRYTGTPCLLSEYRRSERIGDGGWESVEDEQTSTPFLVEDVYGRVPVDPTDGIFRIESEEVAEITEGDTDIKTVERRIEPGDTVHVRGGVRELTADSRFPDESSDAVGRYHEYIGEHMGSIEITEGTEQDILRSYLIGTVALFTIGIGAIEGSGSLIFNELILWELVSGQL